MVETLLWPTRTEIQSLHPLPVAILYMYNENKQSTVLKVRLHKYPYSHKTYKRKTIKGFQQKKDESSWFKHTKG